MKRKTIRLKYKKQRAVWSDVLPYELPLTFSNHYFYDFLLDYDVEFRQGASVGKRAMRLLMRSFGWFLA